MASTCTSTCIHVKCLTHNAVGLDKLYTVGDQLFRNICHGHILIPGQQNRESMEGSAKLEYAAMSVLFSIYTSWNSPTFAHHLRNNGKGSINIHVYITTWGSTYVRVQCTYTRCDLQVVRKLDDATLANTNVKCACSGSKFLGVPLNHS